MNEYVFQFKVTVIYDNDYWDDYIILEADSWDKAHDYFWSTMDIEYPSYNYLVTILDEYEVDENGDVVDALV